MAGAALGLPDVAFTQSHAVPIAELLQRSMVWTADPILIAITHRSDAFPGNAPESFLSDQHAAFVKDVDLPGKPSHATLHLFAYTRYRIYLNGAYIGRGPSRFQNQRPEYDSRDITALLRAGRNRIAILVHRDSPSGRIMYHEPGLAAVLESRDAHGVLQQMATDTRWRAKAELSFGARNGAWGSIEETIDARKESDWLREDFDISHWPLAVTTGGTAFFPLWPRTTPLQTELAVPPKSTTLPLPAELVAPAMFDLELPQIVQGFHRLGLDAEEGSEIEVRYRLPEDATSGASTYIARAGRQTYIGGDTFAQNRLSIHLKSGRLRITDAQVIEVRYPFERVGSFACSDLLLSDLWAICARSIELLSEDSYVDCADRERVEWTDNTPPAFDCTRVMMAGPSADGSMQWSDPRLLKALLRRISLTQQPDGQMKAHSCSERWDIHAIMEDRSCDWAILLEDYYNSTGDKRLVREVWPALTRLMQWFLVRRTTRGLVLAREWEVWDNPLRYQVCEGAGLNALVYRALRAAASCGQAIGHAAESAAYAKDADALQSAFNRLLWDPAEKTYYGGLFGPGSKMNPRLNGPPFTGPIVAGHYQATVQAALFALYSGIVPPDRVEDVRAWLLEHQADVVAPMSHHYLFHALYAMQNSKQDSEVLERMRSGWRPQVESPWQTTWESLKSDDGSRAHIYSAAPGYFLSAFVLGVRREKPVSNRTVLIEPRPGGLAWAKGVVVTEFGPVPVSWKYEGPLLSLTCTIPENVTATVRLPRLGRSDSLIVDGKQMRATTHEVSLETALHAGRHVVENTAPSG